MEAVIPIAVWIVIGLTVLGILAILGFGIRGVVYGKVEPLSVAMVAIPAVVFVLAGLILGNWTSAAIWTVAIMFALGLLSLLFSGVRSFFV